MMHDKFPESTLCYLFTYSPYIQLFDMIFLCGTAKLYDSGSNIYWTFKIIYSKLFRKNV